MLLPYVLAFTGSYHKGKQFGKVDNNNPRVQSAQLTGVGARAVAAQQNAWEALAVFTASLAAAFFAGVEPASLALPALIFAAARIAHAAATSRDLASARSSSFLVATRGLPLDLREGDRGLSILTRRPRWSRAAPRSPLLDPARRVRDRRGAAAVAGIDAARLSRLQAVGVLSGVTAGALARRGRGAHQAR